MERKYLKDELKLSDEQIDKVLAANGADIDRVEAKVTAVTSERDGLQTQLGERDQQLKDFKKSAGDNDELKQQIQTLQDSNKQASEDFKAQLAQTKVDGALQLAMRDYKVRDAKAIMPFLNKDNIKLDDDGKISGLKEQMDAVKKDHDFLFEPDKKPEPIKPISVVAGGNPSGNDSSNESIISKIAERMGGGQ